MCFYWWPKLPQIDGWQQDKSNSYNFSANTQAPTGFNFTDAESVIYAKAIYKLQQPKSKNLEQFITNDKNHFLQANPKPTIKESSQLTSANGLNFRSFSFTPSNNKGNWEQVSYSEEIDDDGNEYYLVFVLSSRSKNGYTSTLGTYKKFIKQYQ